MKQVTEIKSQNGKERKEISFLVISEYTRLKQTSTDEQIKPDDSHLELEWVWWTIICCEMSFITRKRPPVDDDGGTGPQDTCDKDKRGHWEQINRITVSTFSTFKGFR